MVYCDVIRARLGYIIIRCEVSDIYVEGNISARIPLCGSQVDSGGSFIKFEGEQHV